MKASLAAFLLAVTTVVSIGAQASMAPPAEAGIFFNDTPFTYKEYWADHSSFTAGCGDSEVPGGGQFYIEPDGCLKEIFLDIPDDVSGAIAAVIDVNLWRNRSSRSARFTINDGPQYRPNVGRNFSRTPFTATVPLTELRQGANSLKFQEATGPYHVHDVMVRVYYDAANPIVPGPNSDATPPGGQLTGVQALNSDATPAGPVIDPSFGGTLQVDGNRIRLTADATGADYVEFHAYYDGFDEDNDGVTRDWHNFLRMNHGPGGTAEQDDGATIGHIGTDSNAPYEVIWNMPEVVNQENVRFKIRVVDADGNVAEAAGGVSEAFTLARSYQVESYTIPNFPDQAVYFDGVFPQIAELTIDLPTDLDLDPNDPADPNAPRDRAILLGSYWNTPDLSINDHPPFPVFEGAEDTWDISKRETTANGLRIKDMIKPGTNTLRWNYRPPGFGAMIEAPGPMIVIHRQAPSGAPVVTQQPDDALISAGQAASLSVFASGAPTLSYQWLRDGTPIPGATSATYVTPALLASDDGATYSVVVSNGAGSVTSSEATVTVASVVGPTAPWWDSQWDYRVPITSFPESVARTDKVVDRVLNFTTLMANAGSGGPTFDPNSIRVIEVDASGQVVDDAVPFQFEPTADYDPVARAVGSLVWQLTGTTAAGQPRYYHVYFDKTYKGLPAAVVAPQLLRSSLVDLGFDAWQFDMADGSEWVFHLDGGGWSKIIDDLGADWISWNSTPETGGDFRGLPNSVRPPAGYFHPGRLNKTITTIIHEGPLRITFQSRARDNSWITEWSMYPDTAEFVKTRANTDYYVQYEGTPGGEVDVNDVLVRSDGVEIPMQTAAPTPTYEADLPGEEWMYMADTTDGRSFFMAHHQDDGAVESYRLLNEEMPIVAFGRGGLNLNGAYLRRVINGEPHRFTFGLADSVDFATTQDRVLAAYKDVTLQVGLPEFVGVNTGAESDDFSGATIDPVWTVIDPQGDTTLSLTGSSLLFDIPGGVSHDLWEGRDFAPRLLQPVGNDDLDIEVGWLSTPTERFQGQGLLFWEDAQNWVRFVVEHDGTRARVVAYRMENGVASQVAKKNLPGVATRFLRVIRSGDEWIFQRSYNGSRWFEFRNPSVIPLNLTQVGVLATTHAGTPPAFVAELDYFESKTSGDLNDDAPQISNVRLAVESRKATVSWDTNVAADTYAAFGPTTELTENYLDVTPSTTHSVELDFLRCDTPYFVRPQSTSDVGTTVGDVLTFRTDPCPTIVSDDFSTGSLSPFWTLYDPVGDVSFSQSSTNVIMSVPADSEHNLFVDENQAPRLRQPGPVGDFEVEAKFESVLTRRFQIQGIVIEEDEDSFLRFEIHNDGTGIRSYVAPILNNVEPLNFHYGNLPDSPEHYMRVRRTGNTWTMFHSTDGITWSQITTMVVDIESRYVGPYIGNTSTGNATPPGFLGSIDYFFNTDSPISPEDNGAGPDTVAPVVSDVSVTVGTPNAQSVTVDWTTDEPSTTRVDWGLTEVYGDGPLVENTAVTTHSAVIEPVICGTTYNFQASSNDAAGNTGTSGNQTFTTSPCPAAPFSDNFDGSTLDGRWFLDDPRGDSSFLLDGDLLTLSVPARVRHDLTPNNNGALRLLQAVPDGDFRVQAAYESPVDFNFQLQGLVFEQDDDSLIRFDLSNDGTGTQAVVGVLTPGRLDVLNPAPRSVPGAAPSRMRVTRTGTTWTFEYTPDRYDGVDPNNGNWLTVWSGEIGLSVARMGPMAGNANPQLANVPPHSALVDYFWTEADPIAITGTGSDGAPQFQVFDGTGGTWDGVTPFEFGLPGLAQPDINLRGRITDGDGIRSLTYSVNGSEPQAMGIGSTDCEVGVSCTRRLAWDGDWNADVEASRLNAGLNTVTLRAVDQQFNESSIDITVNYTPGQTWPLPYTADWSTTNDLHDLAQPIDGRWAITPGPTGPSLHIEEIGYDRLMAFGDTSWSSFEAEVPITINSFDPAGYEAPSGGPGVGFIPHWRGHTSEDFVQPKFGFSGQLGALIWYRYRSDINGERLEIRDSNAVLVAEDLSGRTLAVGQTYIFKMQAETSGTDGPLYRLKVYPEGTPEPDGWDIVTSLPPEAPDNGSLLLVAHHVDAHFGNLTVREITATAPEVTPASGNYVGLAKIEMSSETRDGEIRYTVDGSDPTATSTLYSEPFFINEGATVKAQTFRAGFNPSPVTRRDYVITPPPDRVATGLEALYRFDEDGGTVVNDTSQQGDVLNLDIGAGSDVTWLADQDALRVNGPSAIRTALGAVSLNNNIKASRAMTVEMWIDPSTFDLGEATLFNIGQDVPGSQNLALSQSGRSLDIDLRTSNTDADGNPGLNSGSIIPPQLHHLVYIRRANGTASVYIDGSEAWSGFRGGNFNPWGGGYGMSIANSIEEINPWQGDIYLMAVYSQDLTGGQVVQNYQAGPFPPPANYPPVADAGPDITLVQGEVATMAASASDDGNPVPPGALTTTWTQQSGPDTAVFSDPSSPTSDVTLPAAGSYVFVWTADDGDKSATDTMRIDVIQSSSQAPAPVFDPPPGAYPGSVSVMISTTVPGGEIRYTTDGTDPDETSALYAGPLNLVDADTTVKARVYRTGLTASNIVEAAYQVTPDSRAEAGMVAQYPFNEPSGTTIKDKVSPLIDLEIAQVGRTTRLDSGLRVDDNTIITKDTSAAKINSPIKASNELTVELWIEPKDLVQTDAMIFGLSANRNARNIGIYQRGSYLDVALRSRSTDSKGEPVISTTTPLPTGLLHVVVTRTAAGLTTVYVNGEVLATGTTSANLGNWVNTHRIHLARERENLRNWLGSYYLVAVYDRALTDVEVLQNYAFGDV